MEFLVIEPMAITSNGNVTLACLFCARGIICLFPTYPRTLIAFFSFRVVGVAGRTFVSENMYGSLVLVLLRTFLPAFIVYFNFDRMWFCEDGIFVLCCCVVDFLSFMEFLIINGMDSIGHKRSHKTNKAQKIVNIVRTLKL